MAQMHMLLLRNTINTCWHNLTNWQLALFSSPLLSSPLLSALCGASGIFRVPGKSPTPPLSIIWVIIPIPNIYVY
jgi:hypothetical protein